MTEIIKIDARVTGFSNDQMRLISLCFPETGEILVQKIEIFTTLPVRPDQQADTIVVTDSPNLIQNWQLKFDPKEHLEEVIKVYQASFRGGLVEFESSLERFNPLNILQVRKIDKNGLQQEFDSGALDNGHIAALISIWASNKIAVSHAVTSKEEVKEEYIDRTMLPFSI
ncbi:hypothetical protein AWW72_14815 [Acinetobacter sp. NRRL B-65365]|uniref:hypothetical protein n=1 Tax=Acinetobacter sp. NRRL B-65365 TaxID=1785092 RepID=UPI0007A09C9E|nr:hypothetical protein [Acinetobacter sp. NRRL B-65365]KYQ83268.1 hypothetical protein AWW72_14815 [Acinetobacter sp. NRRL B-65365]